MQYKTSVIHRGALCFLEVGAYDMAELQEMGSCPEVNISLELDALCCLHYFPNIKRLILRPGSINPNHLPYLRGLNIHSLKLDYYIYDKDTYCLDLSWFPQLEILVARTQHCFSHTAECRNLKTVIVQEWLEPDLSCLAGSSLLALKIIRGKLKSLAGVSDINGLLSLSVVNQRMLADCAELANTAQLEQLMFENCPKINYTDLPEIVSLRYLQLMGNSPISTLAFLSRFPNLQYFLTESNILDGKLERLLSLQYAAVFRNYRHYSLKDAELPKNGDVDGIFSVPTQFNILPESGKLYVP